MSDRGMLNAKPGLVPLWRKIICVANKSFAFGKEL
jgi:hypothetical protein